MKANVFVAEMTSVALRRVAGRLALAASRPRSSSSSSSSSLDKVGDVARATRVFTSSDVATFAELTHDSNPLHQDAAFANSHQFGEPVVHGMLYACMFSAIIGQRSPGAVYLSQTLDFKKPVALGDAVTAEIEVERVAARGRLLDFRTRCFNQRSEVVLSGQARVMLPKQKRIREGESVDT
jgi:acyl dehydratase